MKKFYIYLMTAISLFVAVSCNQEIEENSQKEDTFSILLSAEVIAPTKATLTESDNLNFLGAWEDRDTIKVTINNQQYIAIWQGTMGAFSIDNLPSELKGQQVSISGTYPYSYSTEGTRTQDGQDYNSKYDLMTSEPIHVTLSDDARILLPMVRQTAIICFKVSGGSSSDALASATLQIGDETIEATYTGQYTDNAILWFNANVENENISLIMTSEYGATATISRKSPATFNNGEVYVISKEVEWKGGTTPEPKFVKVTSALDDWSGEYLLVYELSETEGRCWSGVDAADCNVIATIDNGTIAAVPEGASTITIASMTDGYSIKVKGGDNNGKYIVGTKNDNKIGFDAAAQLNTISYNTNDKCVDIISNTSVMRYNSASNNNRFRYFKSSSYTGQQAVQLYKYNAAPVPPAPKYTITLPSNLIGGSVTSNTTEAETGETVTITAYPDNGFKLSTLSANVSDQSLDGNVLTFTMPEANVSITASFEKLPDTDYSGTYAIFAKRETGNYWVMTRKLPSSGTMRFTAEDFGSSSLPGEGYQTTADKLWTIDKTDGGYIISTSNGKQISWISGNSATLTDEGKIVSIQKYNGFFNVSFASSDTETRILALNSTSGNDYFAFYTGSGRTNLAFIPATEIEPQNYTLNISSVSNGTIAASVNGQSVSNGAMIAEGTVVTITATPSSNNYEFEKWNVTGASVGINSTETFTMKSNVTVGASFKEKSSSSQNTILDLTTKTIGTAAYNTTVAYGDWKIVNGANNNKGWAYFKMGGKNTTISSYNPCYIYNTTAISHKVEQITVSIAAGSLSKSGMSVNSWGVYVYSDAKMTNQIDYVSGGTITNSAGLFTFTPSNNVSWNAGYYYKISWNLANTTSTNGIVCVDKITLSSVAE